MMDKWWKSSAVHHTFLITKPSLHDSNSLPGTMSDQRKHLVGCSGSLPPSCDLFFIQHSAPVFVYYLARWMSGIASCCADFTSPVMKRQRASRRKGAIFTTLTLTSVTPESNINPFHRKHSDTEETWFVFTFIRPCLVLKLNKSNRSNHKEYKSWWYVLKHRWVKCRPVSKRSAILRCLGMGVAEQSTACSQWTPQTLFN